MSGILTQQELDDCLSHGTLQDQRRIYSHIAALRACIRQAVLDVEKAPHGSQCPDRPGVCWVKGKPKPLCNCWKVAAIDGLKKRLGEK